MPMKIRALALILAIIFLLPGCAQEKKEQPPEKITVKAMYPVKKDTPLRQEVVGEVYIKEEITVTPKISGQVTAVLTGSSVNVRAGQPLFQLDPREYEAALRNSAALLAQTRASLELTRQETQRFKLLEAQGAIPRRRLEASVSKENEQALAISSLEAQMFSAQNNLNNTQVLAPIAGRIELKDIKENTSVEKDKTPLATIFLLDPVNIRFSLPESDYLQFTKNQALEVSIVPATGEPAQGKISKIEKNLPEKPGLIFITAEFPNPQNILEEKMFVSILVTGGVRKDALLIPQKAIAAENGQSVAAIVSPQGSPSSGLVEGEIKKIPVVLGPKFGSFQIIEDGLAASDLVIVTGDDAKELSAGSPVRAAVMTVAEIAQGELK